MFPVMGPVGGVRELSFGDSRDRVRYPRLPEIPRIQNSDDPLFSRNLWKEQILRPVGPLIAVYHSDIKSSKTD